MRIVAATLNQREVPLRYQISGRQIDIGEALQTHVKTELGAVFDALHDPIVVFDAGGKPVRANAAAISAPILPLERLVMTRTGSSGSSVRPAV